MQNIRQIVFAKRDNKLYKRAISISIIVLSVGFMTYGILSQWDTLIHFQWQIDWKRLVGAFVFFPVGVLPTIYAWHLLIVGFGARQSFQDNVTAFVLSSLPRRLPGIIWYIGSRTLWYQERGTPVIAVLLATVWETLTLGISGLTWYVIITLTSRSQSVFSWSLIGILGLAVALNAGLASPFLLKKISAKIGPVQYISIARLLVVFLAYSIAWINGGIFFYFLVTGICGPLPFWALVSTWLITGATGVLASILQGVGLKELTMTMLLSRLLPISVSATMSIIIRVVHTTAEIALLFSLLPFLCLNKKINTP